MKKQPTFTERTLVSGFPKPSASIIVSLNLAVTLER